MPLDCLTNPPKEAGSYNVSIRGVMSCVAIFWDFDGEKWVTDGWFDGELKANDAHWWEGAGREIKSN